MAIWEDKIEVTLHVIGISPFSNCRQFILILVIYSRDVTHIIYARIHDEAGTRGLLFEYCVKQADAIFLDSLHSNPPKSRPRSHSSDEPLGLTHYWSTNRPRSRRPHVGKARLL